MDTQELQAILDGLDRRLALGEIDIGTYNQLKAKFSARLDKQGPVSATLSALTKEAVALKCPGCMAPLPVLSDPSQASIICEYCGGTFTLQTATEEMERLRSDIRKWISQVAGSAGIGTTVDEASRRFIFKDKLLPPLRTATDRATEVFGMTRYQPLFTFSLLNRLSYSPFHQALQLTPDLGYLVGRVKETIARVQAPEIKVFAVGEKEQYELHTLEVRCLEICYLSNVRHHLASSTPENLQKAKTNLQALADLYGTSSQLSAPIDPSFARLSSALATRMKAVDQAVDILNHLLSSPEGVMTDRVAGNLESAAAQCDQAVTAIEASGREPKESVPAAEGTRIDAQTVRILSACVKLFGQCGAETGESFTRFLATLEQIVEQSKWPASDLTWLSAFLSRIVLHMNAVAGEASLPVVPDFGWVDGRMVNLVPSSRFGSKESAEAEKEVLLPFWVAELDFSQQRGIIFKKGQAVQGLIFLEAARHNQQCHVISSRDPLSAQCYNAAKSPMPIGRSTPAVVPVVSPDDALKRMKQFISSTKGYVGAHTKLLDLVYLPVATVRCYTTKAQRREVLAPSSSIHISTFDIKPVHLGTRELVLAYDRQ